MNDVFADGVILPMIVLLALGWIVPQGLAKIMPEGVRPLMVLACVAFVVLVLLSAAFFAVLYVLNGAPLSAFSTGQAIGHFGRIGLLSGLFWFPLMALSVSNLPHRWKREVW